MWEWLSNGIQCSVNRRVEPIEDNDHEQEPPQMLAEYASPPDIMGDGVSPWGGIEKSAPKAPLSMAASVSSSSKHFCWMRSDAQLNRVFMTMS